MYLCNLALHEPARFERMIFIRRLSKAGQAGADDK
jgi:hypothetical protein